MFQRTRFSWQHQAVVISEQTRLKFVFQWRSLGSLFAMPHKDHFRCSLPDEFLPCAGGGQKHDTFIRRCATDARSVCSPEETGHALKASLVLTCWGHLVFNQLGAGSTIQRHWASTPIHVSRVRICSAVVKHQACRYVLQASVVHIQQFVPVWAREHRFV